MKKNLILITGSVMNSDSNSIDIYNSIISIIDNSKYEILSPLDTMKFNGTNKDRYERAMKILNNTSIMIAEMSNVSTGQGMEIQQAATLEIPILVIAKKNCKISGLVKGCNAVKRIIFYDNIDLIKSDISNFIEENIN